MLAAILSLLQSLPDILKLIKEFTTWIHDNFEDSPKKFIKDTAEAVKKLNEAKNEQESIDALKALQNLYKRI